jgi:NADH:ubiquinone oxidoreductase subunit F (NADH-binding)
MIRSQWSEWRKRLVCQVLQGSKPQVRIALRNCGVIDPGNIDHYASRGGYSGLSKVLRMTTEEVIEEVGKSGLRERGGDGFPTGEKWRLCFDAPGSERYVICNAIEGDPDSLIARTLLEGDPHSVLEGMTIGAYSTGATLGYVFISAEEILAIGRLKTALSQMEDRGLLGDRILGSGFSFHIEVKEGTGNLAYSDETLLINAMEGKQTMPFVCSSRPPTSGLGGKPTLIHQAETWAHVSAILEKGAEWYASFGTEQCRGTKIINLFGKVMHLGLVEVPMGTSLRKIVYDIGGGIPNGKRLKAMKIGGPTGGYLPASSLDLPVDYEHLFAAGTLTGSGSILVIDGDACIVDQAKCSLFSIQNESCGKCVFCREGTMQMAEILTDITEGRGKIHDIELLLELGEGLRLGAQCLLGRTAPNSILTVIRYFREELEAHINERQCPARVCKKLEAFPTSISS